MNDENILDMDDLDIDQILSPSANSTDVDVQKIQNLFSAEEWEILSREGLTDNTILAQLKTSCNRSEYWLNEFEMIDQNSTEDEDERKFIESLE